MKKLPANLLLVNLLLTTAHAQEISYAPIVDYSVGVVNYINPLGGEYVYGPSDIANLRLSHRTITISELDGQFDLFSPEEEQVLANALNKELAARMKQRLGSERSRYKAKMANLDWPKIVFKDGQYCFPTLTNDEKSWESGTTYCIASDAPNKQSANEQQTVGAAPDEQ